MSFTPESLHEMLDDLLAATTQAITGGNGETRPGQVALAHDVLAAMLGKDGQPGHVLGCAPTGTGKSVSYGLPALMMAAYGLGRTVISTESIGLQTQLVAKDLPLMAQQVRTLVGVEPAFAVHKGFGNYVCPARALASTQEALRAVGVPTPVTLKDASKRARDAAPVAGAAVDEDGAPLHRPDPLRNLLVDTAAQCAGALAKPLTAITNVTVDRSTVKVGNLLALGQWSLLEAASSESGDRTQFDGVGLDRTWGLVSTTPNDCAGTNCPLWRMCPAVEARRRASEADVIVTNHTLLALQASQGVAAVLSNGLLGQFRHLVVDEAHALPQITRNAGARVVDAARIHRAAKRVEDVLSGGRAGSLSGGGRAIVEQGVALATSVDERLTQWLAAHQDTSRRFGTDLAATRFSQEDDEHPLDGLADAVAQWARSAALALPSTRSLEGNLDDLMRVRSVKHAIGSLVGDLTKSVGRSLASTNVDPYEEEEPDEDDVEPQDMAHWVEPPERGFTFATYTGTSLRMSPIDVAPLIAGQLFSAALVESPEEKAARKAAGKPPVPRSELPQTPLSVTMLSATIPPGFSREAGIRVDGVRDYESPFAATYAASMLYVPRIVDEPTLDRVAPRRGGRRRFDPAGHAQWVAGQVVDLVAANGGSALVLSANAANGRLYAEALRVAGGPYTVHSQWDGGDPRRIAAAWREDVDSVMVGTRSFMTGVDAPGETCSMVIIDRPSRSAGNVVDDARVEMLTKRADMDRWAAERAVYVSDAGLLLDQSAGRLIRRVTDVGLVAVLDPRLMKGTPISYPEATRAAYMRALTRFTQRTGTEQVALDFVSDRRRKAAA